MNYTSELKKFVTSQYIYSGVRIALAVVIPSIILAYLGVLKQYFLFPLGTIFLALTDMPGPFHRRRNSLILALFFYFFVALIAGLLKDFPILIFLEIIIFGLFFTMLGIYGKRLDIVGSLTLVVFAIFIDGAPGFHSAIWNAGIFTLGATWFFIVFLLVTVLKPYKLAEQMIGENYIELGKYLRIKSKFYLKNPDFEGIYKEIFGLEVRIKEHQEATREVVFKTRQMVKESTSTSRLLMQLFLNSFDLHEMLILSTNDYRKLQKSFGDKEILEKINIYLNKLSNELINIGISIQGGMKAAPIINISDELHQLHEDYFELRNKEMNAETLENFMILRQIFLRITEISEELQTIYKIKAQDIKLVKSLSSGLDLEKFVTKEEKLNYKVFINNFSLKSNHFRHAIRITLAMLIGYTISKFSFLEIHKVYWILITILAIMRPAYSITKRRNILRIYGTVAGAIVGFLIVNYISNPLVLLIIFLVCLMLTFSLLKDKYAWAVFFMTIYIFLIFDFLKPGNFQDIFFERLYDTFLAAIIVFLVSYLVLPVWEHQKNKTLILNYLKANQEYFNKVIDILNSENVEIQEYKMSRKNAIISLANLSDNFQKMLSDPKDQQKNLENIHLFVTTSHLFTAYVASLSQYAQKRENYSEIDLQGWKQKINHEVNLATSILEIEQNNQLTLESKSIVTHDTVDELLEKRKKEIKEEEFLDRRDPKAISHLTELKNIKELLELIYNEAREQRKIAKKLV
ncbi:membrane protein [Cloacibacterium rupense]|uniref:Membrane protein n=1 Tax=Cloacibacterium rupense TaxID=517423 RepID=A0ABQ2NJE5_9FLAO|nr:FUSC family membrane protein [Cloacibacterium rupense]GGP04887.1 membrane protein [Cloacibacterium rupense]